MTVEVFLDDTPGETRGVVARDGRFTHLLIRRDDDPAQTRLGARAIGRVLGPAGAGGATVDLGGGVTGFLAADRFPEGQAVEVAVTAEPRDGKGATLKAVRPADGPPRLLDAGLDVAARLAEIAPGVAPITAAVAIRAADAAVAEALSPSVVVTDLGLDVRVERTRALIAVDLDLSSTGGRGARAARARANLRGVAEAGRLIALKGWGGLVAVDLIGTGHDGEALTRAARAAFRAPETVIGRVDRFGVLMLSTPWRTTPVEARTGASPLDRAIDGARRIRLALFDDPGAARSIAVCRPDVAEPLAPLLARIGPRAQMRVDPAAPAVVVVEEA